MTLPPENTRQIPRERLQKGPLATASKIINLFSYVDPPFPVNARLCTVGISHYCEKVRWGFDLLANTPSKSFTYHEDAHPPGLASLATTSIHPTISASPMVVDFDNDENVITDSTAILRHYLPELYPSDDVLAAEEDLDARLGAATRVFAYHHILDKSNLKLMADMATNDTSAIESFLFKFLTKRNVLQPGMRKFMVVNEESAQRSEEEIHRVFAEISAKVEKTGFIVGDTFTAADLTFAALATPLLSVQQFDYLYNNSRTQFPPRLLATAEKLIDTAAGKHVEKCYDCYRFGRIENNKIVKGGLGQVKYRGGPRDRTGMMVACLGLMGGVIGSALSALM